MPLTTHRKLDPRRRNPFSPSSGSPVFKKAGLIVIACSSNLMSYQVGKLGPIQRYKLLPSLHWHLPYCWNHEIFRGNQQTFFEKLAVKEPGVSSESLLAKSYIGMSEFLFSDFNVIILQIPICRRRSQRRSINHGCSHKANASSIIYLAACSVWFSSFERTTSMGTQARTSSCQLRTQRVCYVEEIGRYLHRSNAMIRLGMAILCILLPVAFFRHFHTLL